LSKAAFASSVAHRPITPIYTADPKGIHRATHNEAPDAKLRRTSVTTRLAGARPNLMRLFLPENANLQQDPTSR
jgi:hypothetical protein